jgi:hypothetical protein
MKEAFETERAGGGARDARGSWLASERAFARLEPRVFITGNLFFGSRAGG